MGPEATLQYYRLLTYGYQRITGNSAALPYLSVESVDMYAMLALCERKTYDELTDFLLRPLDNLAAAGATFAAMATNTPHVVFDRLAARSPLPLVDIVDCSVDEAARLGCRRVGVLGTMVTMREEFYKRPFRDKGINVIVPEGRDMVAVHQHIMEELERGIIRETTRRIFVGVIDRMIEKYDIDAVMLACTELPLLLGQKDVSITCLDSMAIHVERILHWMLR